MRYARAMARVARTVLDDQSAVVIGRLLEQSRGAPRFVRVVVDLVRAALAAAATTAAWPYLAPLVTSRLPESIPPSSHGVVLGALSFVMAMTVSFLVFRFTSRCFAQPLRARSS